MFFRYDGKGHELLLVRTQGENFSFVAQNRDGHALIWVFNKEEANDFVDFAKATSVRPQPFDAKLSSGPDLKVKSTSFMGVVYLDIDWSVPGDKAKIKLSLPFTRWAELAINLDLELFVDDANWDFDLL